MSRLSKTTQSPIFASKTRDKVGYFSNFARSVLFEIKNWDPTAAYKPRISCCTNCSSRISYELSITLRTHIARYTCTRRAARQHLRVTPARTTRVDLQAAAGPENVLPTDAYIPSSTSILVFPHLPRRSPPASAQTSIMFPPRQPEMWNYPDIFTNSRESPRCSQQKEPRKGII